MPGEIERVEDTNEADDDNGGVSAMLGKLER